MHGGVPRTMPRKTTLKVLEMGLANLDKHIENLKKFGLPVVVHEPVPSPIHLE